MATNKKMKGPKQKARVGLKKDPMDQSSRLRAQRIKEGRLIRKLKQQRKSK